jgi:hypothetical protein
VKYYMLIGLLLIVLGVASFVYHGVTYTTRENVVHVGPIHMTTDKTNTIALPPVVGVIALVGGIVLVALGGKSGWKKAI